MGAVPHETMGYADDALFAARDEHLARAPTSAVTQPI